MTPESTIARPDRIRQLGLGTALASALLASAGAQALIIDDLSTAQGPISVTAPNSETDIVSGLGIIGGERTALVSPTNFQPAPTVSFQVAAGTMTAGADASPHGGQIGLTYGGPLASPPLGYDLAADFTDGGTSDRILVEVSGVTGHVAYIVNVYDSFGNFLQTPGLPEISAAGLLSIQFAGISSMSGAGASFSAVGALQLFFIFEANESIGITSICTGSAGSSSCATQMSVPEPTALALVAMGLLAGLGATGRRHG